MAFNYYLAFPNPIGDTTPEYLKKSVQREDRYQALQKKCTELRRQYFDSRDLIERKRLKGEWHRAVKERSAFERGGGHDQA